MLRELPTDFKISPGFHTTPEEGLNFLEAVAYLAGEPFDPVARPACACPVLTAVGGCLPVYWMTHELPLLVPFIPQLVGSVVSAEVARRRRYVLIDGALR